MRRRLFTLAAGVSAALCVAMLALGVRRGPTRDLVEWGAAGGPYVQVFSQHHGLIITAARPCPAEEPARWLAEPTSAPNEYWPAAGSPTYELTVRSYGRLW